MCSRQAVVTSVSGDPQREKAVILAEEQGVCVRVRVYVRVCVLHVRVCVCVKRACVRDSVYACMRLCAYPKHVYVHVRICIQCMGFTVVYYTCSMVCVLLLTMSCGNA